MAAAHARVRRLAVGILCAAIALVVISFAARVSVSVGRIFGRHAGIALTQPQIALAHKEGSTRPVPRILHQIYHDWGGLGNESIPDDWAELRRSCLALHPTWEHKLWNESASRDFIQTEYAWFLEIYDGFRFPIQRVDTLRYFLLRHFGGVYMDLDNGCRASLEPLLHYPVWVTDTGRGPLSTNIMGAEPEHPFWLTMTSALASWAGRDFTLPYLTVNYATGRWFQTEMWQLYHARKPRRSPDLVRILMNDGPDAVPWVFFTAERDGSSWGERWDEGLLDWAGNHVLQAAAVLLWALAGVSVLFAIARAMGGASLLSWSRRRMRASEKR